MANTFLKKSQQMVVYLGKGLGYLCFVFWCWPAFLWCLWICRNGRGYCGTRTRQQQQRLMPLPPLALPPDPRPSRRSLSNIMRPNGKDRMLCDQSVSPLFRKLPPEIRLEIFKRAIGGRVLHVGLKRDVEEQPESLARLRCLRCRYGCNHPETPSAFTGCSNLQEDRKKSLLPLLMTCRRM